MGPALPLLLAAVVAGLEAPPPGFKVAFFGDQGLGSSAEAVLRLVKNEKADVLVHLGDFDYALNPAAWEAQTDAVLGKDFPLFAVMGNHDLPAWGGESGYQNRIRARLQRLGIAYRGEPGARYSFRYRGVFFVFTAPGLMPQDHPGFIRRELEGDSSVWRISGWHVNQSLMQAGGKGDEAGWGVYEESRKGGAIVATAHEHSYSRTHLLRSMSRPWVESRSDTLPIAKGRTFAFVSGLGGGEIRPQLRRRDWWAKVYSATQGATHGALFGVFHVEGNPRQAFFYFKNVEGDTVDRFAVFSGVGLENGPSANPGPNAGEGRPFWPRLLRLSYSELGLPPDEAVRVYNLSGLAMPARKAGGMVELTLRNPGIFFIRPARSPGRKIVVLP